MKIKIKCLNCNKTITNSKRTKFCSDKCMRYFHNKKHHKGEKITHCIKCGNPLTGKKTKFCSNQCLKKHYKYKYLVDKRKRLKGKLPKNYKHLIENRTNIGNKIQYTQKITDNKYQKIENLISSTMFRKDRYIKNTTDDRLWIKFYKHDFIYDVKNRFHIPEMPNIIAILNCYEIPNIYELQNLEAVPFFNDIIIARHIQDHINKYRCTYVEI